MKLLQLPARLFYIFFRFLLAIAVRLLYRVSVEGKDNLKALKNHLREGAVIMALNHLSFDDTWIVGGVFLLMTAKEISRAIVPVSLKWWKTRLGWVLRLLYLLGTKPLPIVQYYEKDLYSRQEILHHLKALAKEVHQTLGAKGGLILIHPEGTRSFDGTLQEKIQPGIDFLVKRAVKGGSNVVIIPVALEPKGVFSGRTNFGNAFIVHFGKALPAKEVQERSEREGISPGELIKGKIAKLLPEKFAPQAKKAEH